MLLSKSAAKTVLVITPGEPAGIGPDLLLGINQANVDATLIGIADPIMLEARAALLGQPTDFHLIGHPSEAVPDRLNILPMSCKSKVEAGILNTDNSQYVLDTLKLAVSLCEAKECDGMVTGPVNKAVINDAGIPFTGHTEWLATRTGTRKVVMMLAAGSLRVALATTHLPLREVADAINQDDLLTTLDIIQKSMIDHFGLQAPRIMVCGLNPHAGESGHLGREEIDVIEPALAIALQRGINVSGPIPADTAFTPNSLAQADVVLAMYHDQGLPVLKHHGFGEAVNITLGLPIIRTSVDHGTALDLTGTGTADAGSLMSAIRYAIQMASVRAS
jgi:4-hydroxythreonine-4-phosphate dehydrogenase